MLSLSYREEKEKKNKKRKIKMAVTYNNYQASVYELLRQKAKDSVAWN